MIYRALLGSLTGSTSAAFPPAWTRSTPTFGRSVMVPGLAWWPTMITTGQVFPLSFDLLFISSWTTENDTWGSCLGTGHCHQYHEQNLTIQDYHSVGWHYLLTCWDYSNGDSQESMSHATMPPTLPTITWSRWSATTLDGTLILPTLLPWARHSHVSSMLSNKKKQVIMIIQNLTETRN